MYGARKAGVTAKNDYNYKSLVALLVSKKKVIEYSIRRRKGARYTLLHAHTRNRSNPIAAVAPNGMQERKMKRQTLCTDHIVPCTDIRSSMFTVHKILE